MYPSIHPSIHRSCFCILMVGCVYLRAICICLYATDFVRAVFAFLWPPSCYARWQSNGIGHTYGARFALRSRAHYMSKSP
ncbi:hypothetical protein BDF19DRAFT_429751 [Syncephalis fuscata]|nr:hypothetical protein BDF19DRAFT_429751 [Syncephalis fuscata]